MFIGLFNTFKNSIFYVFSNKWRLTITSMGLFFGVSALLCNLALLRGIDDDVRQRMMEIGNLDVVTLELKEPYRPVDNPGEADQNGTSFEQGLHLQDIRYIEKSTPMVKYALLENNLGWLPVSYAGTRAFANVQAIGQHSFQNEQYPILTGEKFQYSHFKRDMKVCLIGEGLAKEMFGQPVSAIGKKITLQNNPLFIIGVLKEKSTHEINARMILIPFSLYASYLSKVGKRYDNVKLQLNGNYEDLEKGVTEIKAALVALFRGANPYHVELNAEKMHAMRQINRGIKTVFWLVACICLTISGVNVLNIMLASLRSRIREIGINKALGLNDVELFFQYLLEAVVFCLLGGLPGLLVGVIINLLPKDMFPFQLYVTLSDFAVSILFIFLVGLLSGIYPSLKAVNYSPVKALRF